MKCSITLKVTFTFFLCFEQFFYLFFVDFFSQIEVVQYFDKFGIFHLSIFVIIMRYLYNECMNSPAVSKFLLWQHKQRTIQIALNRLTLDFRRKFIHQFLKFHLYYPIYRHECSTFTAQMAKNVQSTCFSKMINQCIVKYTCTYFQ